MQCPACGFEHTFRTCPNCGHVSPDLPPLPAQPQGRPGLPWDRRAELGALDAALQTIKGVLLEPVATYRAMRVSGGIGEPFLFGFVLMAIGGLVGVVWQAVGEAVGLNQNPWAEQLGGSNGPGMVGMLCGGLIGVPIGVAIALFLGSGIIHLCLMLFGGARAGFEATFRVYAYAGGSTAPFQVIPICGGLIGGVWAIVAVIIGLREAHETDTWRAVGAVLLPVVLCCACIAIAAIMFGAAIAAAVAGAANQ